MDIASAKEQVKRTVAAYLATDAQGRPKIPLSRQRPLLVIGAPGVGKTAIVEQVASELGISLVSYSMTHHTRQSALGLPVIRERTFDGHDYDVSEYTMSEIIASVHEAMETSGLEHGILFLDEVNCVSETLTPSMLQFLQYKTFGRHRVPDGWVIVTAGNPPEYNRNVHEFDVATLDRVRRIDVEPDLAAWKPYAAEIGAHPAILAFLEAKPGNFYRVERGLSGREFVTARSWVDLSEALAVHEELGFPTDTDLIGQFIQLPELAAEFSLYLELFNRHRRDYRTDDILAGNVTDEVLQKARDADLDERLSVVFALLDSLGARVRGVIDTEDVLLAVRTELREIRDSSSDENGVRNLLNERAAARREHASKRASAGGLTQADLEREQAVADMLEDLVHASASGTAGTSSATPAAAPPDSPAAPASPPPAHFAAVQAAYDAAVAALDDAAAAASAELDALYAFLDAAFADGPETTIATTELTARAHTSRFVSEYGSDAYFAHSSELLVSSRAGDLQKRISALDGAL